MHGVEHSFKGPTMDENYQKVSFLDIFAFSGTFFGIKVKYCHLKRFPKI